jgi:glycerol kinase
MQMASYILALDQGTTSSRAIVFDGDGVARGVAQREFPQLYPRPGWVEHDPDAIWSTQYGAAAEAIAAAGITPADVAAIGIANQRETTLVWERRSGRPIHHAIVWQDRRTAGMVDRLRTEGVEPLVRERTGLLLDAYFSATKIAWILEHVPGARDRAAAGELAFGTVDSWLIWRLTGGAVHATDVTNACRTMLFNIHTMGWDDDLLEVFRVPRAMVPEVHRCAGVVGEAGGGPLPAGVPIAGIAGDQQAATFGQGCFARGQGKSTYGTGCFIVLNTGSAAVPSDNRLLTTLAWQLDREVTYALEGSIFIAGAVVQWLRDELGLIRRAADVEALARSVPDNGGVVLVPAFAGLGAPHWDQYARGAIFGLTRGAGAGHLARAALEAIAFQVVDVVAAMEADSGIALAELRVDGGAAGNDLLLQLQSDLLGVPVVRPKVLETTALGAAYLAGLAVGVWSGLDDLAGHWQEDRRFEPAMTEGERRSLLGRWHDALERAKGWERQESRQLIADSR